MTTGIPIEWMFGVLAALIAVVYANLVWEIRKLRRSSHKHTGQLDSLMVWMSIVCDKLGIPWSKKSTTENGE